MKNKMNLVWSGMLFSTWLLLFISVDLISIIEGKLNPVVTNLELTYIGDKQVIGSLTKLREECDFIGMKWFIMSEDGVIEEVVLKFMPEKRDFPIGRNSFGPLILNTEVNMLSASNIRMHHICTDNILTDHTTTIVPVKDIMVSY
jgi:hypothetical protein